MITQCNCLNLSSADPGQGIILIYFAIFTFVLFNKVETGEILGLKLSKPVVLRLPITHWIFFIMYLKMYYTDTVYIQNVNMRLPQ